MTCSTLSLLFVLNSPSPMNKNVLGVVASIALKNEVVLITLRLYFCWRCGCGLLKA